MLLPVLTIVTRRAALTCGPLAAAVVGPLRALATSGPLGGLSAEEIARLDEESKGEGTGVVRPNGVRVIDLLEGTGRQPAVGDRVWVAYKVWANGFRAGPVADWSYMDGVPYSWTLGTPTDRIPPGVDQCTLGMREGGWRRLIVPNAYGTAGLRRVTPVRGGGRYEPPKAGYAIAPGAFAFFDLIMIDGGSGRCDAVLRPEGVPEERARKLRSLTCLPGEVSDDFNIATGVRVR